MSQDGNPLPVQANCPHCGARLEPGYKFCISCGNPVEAPAAPESTPAEPEATEESQTPESESVESIITEHIEEGAIDFREILNYPFSEGERAFFRNAIPFSLMLTLGAVLCYLSGPGPGWLYALAVVPFSIAGAYAMTTLQHNIRETITSLLTQEGSELRRNALVVSIPVAVGMLLYWYVDAFSDMAGYYAGSFAALAVVVVMMGFFVYATLVVVAHYAAQGVGVAAMDVGTIRSVTRSNWFGFLAVLIFWVAGVLLMIPLQVVIVALGIYCLFKYRYKPREQEDLSFLVDLVRRLVLSVHDWFAGKNFQPEKRAKIGLLRSTLAVVGSVIAIVFLTWVASLYWVTTVSARLLAHTYRGEKIEFRRTSLEL